MLERGILVGNEHDPVTPRSDVRRGRVVQGLAHDRRHFFGGHCRQAPDRQRRMVVLVAGRNESVVTRRLTSVGRILPGRNQVAARGVCTRVGALAEGNAGARIEIGRLHADLLAGLAVPTSST